MHLEAGRVGLFHHAGEDRLAGSARLGHHHGFPGTDSLGIGGDGLHGPRLEHPVVVIGGCLALGIVDHGLVPVGLGHQLHQLEIHAHGGHQLAVDALEFVGIEALQIDLVALAGVAVLLELVQHRPGDVLALVAE